MAYRLKNRQMQIPNGYSFIQGETGWQSRRGSSFHSIAVEVMNHRLANPHLSQQHGWKTDMAGCEQDVEDYNVKVCMQMGWFQYLQGGDGSPLPKASPLPHHLSRNVANVAAGSEVLVEWIASGAEAVSKITADNRARICAQCPQNKKGDLLSFFTKPVSEAIRKLMSARSEWKLETPDDAALGVCSVCSCPMKLKVWMPIERIRSKLSPETIAALDPSCWIPKE